MIFEQQTNCFGYTMWSHDMKWKILERPLLCIVMQIMTRKNSYRTKLPIFCQRTCNMCVMCAYIIHNLTYSPYKYILHTCFSCKKTPSVSLFLFHSNKTISFICKYSYMYCIRNDEKKRREKGKHKMLEPEPAFKKISCWFSYH